MKLRAFTLIELLIVVAIIAILAAIAVPNFLEAQVRAKVSRAKADMQALGTAIEMYTLDHNRTPTVLSNYPASPDRRNGPSLVNSALEGLNWNSYRMKRLTTPVAYVSTVLPDVFAPNGRTKAFDGSLSLQYDSFDYSDERHDSDFGGNNLWAAKSSGGTWKLSSAGPDNIQAYGGRERSPGTDSGNLANKYGMDYDPTNGTVSRGDIVRVGGAGRILPSNPPKYDRVRMRFN